MTVLSFPWTANGWDGRPEEREAAGTEIMYRAYDLASDATSKLWGGYFFMPRVVGQNILHLTAAQLEIELNAALWGNNFERMAMFRLRKGSKYLVGNVAQGDYSEKDGKLDLVFQAQSFVVPSGIFCQVFVADSRKNADLLQEDIFVRRGGMARKQSVAWH